MRVSIIEQSITKWIFILKKIDRLLFSSIAVVRVLKRTVSFDRLLKHPLPLGRFSFKGIELRVIVIQKGLFNFRLPGTS